MIHAVVGFGPGKVILLGEHGVVYGHPALAAPLSKGVRAIGEPSKQCELAPLKGLTQAQRDALQRAFAVAAISAGKPKLKVTVESELPVSMGLGSSGALSVAVARVLLGPNAAASKVEKLAFSMEKEFHGTPSGVDHTTSARGAPVLFQKGKARTLKAKKPVKVLVALLEGRPPTKLTVAGLRERQANWPKRYAKIFEVIGANAKEGARALEAGDLESLGDLMNLNQGLLAALQLSSDRVDALCRKLRTMGALGAKLTGAGGDGGAVLGLFREPEPAVMSLREAGIDCFASQLAGPVAL